MVRPPLRRKNGQYSRLPDELEAVKIPKGDSMKGYLLAQKRWGKPRGEDAAPPGSMAKYELRYIPTKGGLKQVFAEKGHVDALSHDEFCTCPFCLRRGEEAAAQRQARSPWRGAWRKG